MEKLPVQLGVCFSGRQLYYAANLAGSRNTLERIGKVDFNFDVQQAILGQDPDAMSGINALLTRLREDFKVDELRVLYPATQETWSALPKSVYDQSSEREAYLKILKHGEPRQDLEPFWYDINNRDFRFLAIRNKKQSATYQALGESFKSRELCSEFEIGTRWLRLSRTSDAFKIIGCYENHIVVSSFVMGKFRAATYIRFRYLDDLSYMWLQQGTALSWLKGVHDTVYYYGPNAFNVIEVIETLLESGTRGVRLDNLDYMQVFASEETYGFRLEEAFPAIVLAL